MRVHGQSHADPEGGFLVRGGPVQKSGRARRSSLTDRNRQKNKGARAAFGGRSGGDAVRRCRLGRAQTERGARGHNVPGADAAVPEARADPRAARVHRAFFPRNRVGRHRTAASAAPHCRSAVRGRPAAAFERGHQIRGNRRPAYEHAEWLFLANGALDWRVDGKRAQAGTRSASPATRRRGATGTPSEARHGQGGCLPGITRRTVRGKIGAVTAGERPAGAYYTRYDQLFFINSEGSCPSHACLTGICGNPPAVVKIITAFAKSLIDGC